MPIVHAFSSSIADGGDTTLVRPSNWNADHVITAAKSGTLTTVSGSSLVPVTSGNVWYDEASNHLEFSGSNNAICFIPAATDNGQAVEEGEVILFGTRQANRTMISVQSPLGGDYELGPHFGANRYVIVQANGNANSYSTWGAAAATATGTATTANWANTSYSSSLKRVDHPAGAANGGAGGLRGPAAFYSLGDQAGKGGFYYVARAIVAVTGATNNMRFFSGMTTGTSNPPNADPSSFFNMIGIGKDATDTTYQFMVNDGAGSATKTSTGFTVVQGDVIETKVYCPPSGTTIGMHFHVISVGGTGTVGLKSNSVEYTASANLPANTLGLNWHLYVQNTGSTATRIGVMNVTIESDT